MTCMVDLGDLYSYTVANVVAASVESRPGQ